MSDCCSVSASSSQKKPVLITVLILNAVMFIVQISAAVIGHSTSLLADSFDMLGDALTYSFSLYVVNRSTVWQTRAALLKAGIIMVFAIGIVLEAVIKVTVTEAMPDIMIMTVFSVVALLVNGLCFYLLTRHRHADINLYSTWICARNDIICNVSVLAAAGLIYVLDSRWPDIIIGLLLAGVLLKSAWGIIYQTKNTISNF